ncbi:VWA domain-containing protein [Hazenella coriacea]|uniref:von Willebrand factor type A domain-containing protein n=1 Tax=Hazenella coriacea TaxID=1179467 RepID=A0A4R3L2E6_9BACL|nr:VWA domain-containing protein [Hazenella coriacea]TCS92360.1 von Willebrand factor type A domain-containing protein [Hazenella coriacea]
MRVKANKLWLAVNISLCFCLSGCATVVQQIQNTTGSQIEKVDELAVPSEVGAKDAESQFTDVKASKSPSPSTDLESILADEGRGEYAGKKYDPVKVEKALKQMPKGLTEDKAYAYLLGLVGESYKQDAETFSQMQNPEYQKQIDAWKKMKTVNPVPAPSPVPANSDQAKKKANVVVLLDASGSMGAELGEKKRMDLAKEGVQQLTSILPPDTSIHIKAYGHRGNNGKDGKAESCSVTENIYSGVLNQPHPLQGSLNQIKATGWTPLARAIQESAKEMQNGAPSQVENFIIVFGDGTESCNGDPLTAAAQTHQSKSLAHIDVVGIDVNTQDSQELRDMANVAGGNFQSVTNEDEMLKVLFEQQKKLQMMNQPWGPRALDSMARLYKLDNQRLNTHHEEVIEKTKQEYERLDQANNYIKEQGKIEGDDWVTIGNWIDSRWKQVGKYTDQRWKEVSEQMDVDYHESLVELEKEWKTDEGDPALLNKQKEQLLNEAPKEREDQQIETQVEAE